MRITHRLAYGGLAFLAFLFPFLVPGLLQAGLVNLAAQVGKGAFRQAFQDPEFLQVASYAFMAFLVVAIYLVLAKRLGRGHCKQPVTVPGMLKAGILGIGVSGLSFLWLHLAMRIPALAESWQRFEAMNQFFSGGSMLTLALTAAVLVPLIEEILFRGIVLQALEHVQAGLFALAHGILIQEVYTFLMGLVAGLVFIKTRQLSYPVLIHMVNNGLSVAIEGMGGGRGEALANGFAMAMMIPMAWILWHMLHRLPKNLS